MTHIKKRTASPRVKPSVDRSDINGKHVSHKEESIRSGKWYELKSFHALPHFLQDNEYLLHFHRPQIPSFTNCVRSIFRLHTETWNIWTHLFGSLAFVIITAHLMIQPTIEVSWQQKIIFLVFFLGAIFCMGASAVYHAFLCHSEPVHKYLNKLDYCGVITLEVSSFSPWVFYGFYCHWLPSTVYLFFVSALWIVGIIVVMQDKFATPKYRVLRAVVFIAVGLTGVVPGIHFAMTHDLTMIQDAAFWIIFMAVLYIAGGLIYAARVPERLKPGKFDIWCQSHQIMHLCVVGGALSCYYGATKLALSRLSGDLKCVEL